MNEPGPSPTAFQTADPSPDTRRLEPIDALRGIAIIAVALYHAIGASKGWDLPWDGWFRSTQTLGPARSLGLHLLLQGWIGVPLFFVLSGFCIHYGFLRSRTPFSVSQFLQRRFWRIYPAYILALTAAVAYQIHSRILNPALPADQWQILSHVLLIQNLSPDSLYGIVAAFWSIAIEFQLYLLYPLLLLIRQRIGIQHTLLLGLILSLLAKTWIIGSNSLPDRIAPVGIPGLLNHWFDWMLGAWAAERFVIGGRIFHRPLMTAAILLPLALLSTWIKPLLVFSFTLFALVSTVLLEIVLDHPAPQRFPARILILIGTISYSLYLWHQPLQTRLHDLLHHRLPSPVAWSLGSLTLIALGWILYQAIEIPGIRLGRRLQKTMPKPG